MGGSRLFASCLHVFRLFPVSSCRLRTASRINTREHRHAQAWCVSFFFFITSSFLCGCLRRVCIYVGYVMPRRDRVVFSSSASSNPFGGIAVPLHLSLLLMRPGATPLSNPGKTILKGECESPARLTDCRQRTREDEACVTLSENPDDREEALKEEQARLRSLEKLQTIADDRIAVLLVAS